MSNINVALTINFGEYFAIFVKRSTKEALLSLMMRFLEVRRKDE